MKISIFTTITNPEERKYPYLEALESFCDVADEVIVVDGGSTDGSLEKIDELAKQLGRQIKAINLPWPWEYSQAEFPKHLNAGLEACTGDWAIKMDIDYLFHENQIDELKVLLRGYNDRPCVAGQFLKFNVMTRDRGFLKSRLPLAIHKKVVGDNIKFGIQQDIDKSLDDWSFPILWSGKYNKEGVPVGTSLPAKLVLDLGIKVWNYDYFFRTKEETKKLFARNAKAWRLSVNNAWGASDEESWETFLDMNRQRWEKDLTPLEPISHPKYIRERVEKMTPGHFGWDNWGMKTK